MKKVFIIVSFLGLLCIGFVFGRAYRQYELYSCDFTAKQMLYQSQQCEYVIDNLTKKCEKLCSQHSN